MDNTYTLNDNDHQELTDMVILDNPQTERVNDNNDRETSGSNDPQNCMNTVIDSEEFAYRIGSYVDLCLDNSYCSWWRRYSDDWYSCTRRNSKGVSVCKN